MKQFEYFCRLEQFYLKFLEQNPEIKITRYVYLILININLRKGKKNYKIIIISFTF